MSFRKEFVTGVLAFALTAAAIASPVVACLTGLVGGNPPPGFSYLPPPASGFVNITTYFRWLLNWFGTRQMVEVRKEVLSIRAPAELRVNVTGGYVNVFGWRREGLVKVVIMASYQTTATPYWRVRRVGRVLSVEAGWCSVLIYVPPDAVASLYTAVRDGGVILSLKGVKSLRLLNLSVIRGDTRIRLGGATDLTLVARMLSGSFDGAVSLEAGATPSTSVFSVGVKHGKASLHVIAPGYGVRAYCRSSGGAALLIVGDWRNVAFNGSLHYVTPGYSNSLMRIAVNVSVSGGDAEAWVSG